MRRSSIGVFALLTAATVAGCSGGPSTGPSATGRLVFQLASTGTGAPYTEFKTLVGQRLPGANTTTPAPIVTITQPGLTANSSDVRIVVYWQPPGEPTRHQYEVVATVAQN